MVVRIRLARFGKAKQPVYNIVVTKARTARGSKPLEVLGTFEPFPKQPIDGEGRQYKDVKLDITRAKYWLGTGAQPSDAAWRLLQKAGLLPEQFHIAEAKWRASVVDDLSRKAQAGEMTIKEYVRAVSQLRYFPGEREAPSDMPVADPFAEDEAEVTTHIRQDTAGANGAAGKRNDLDDFFKAMVKRGGVDGSLEKAI